MDKDKREQEKHKPRQAARYKPLLDWIHRYGGQKGVLLIVVSFFIAVLLMWTSLREESEPYRESRCCMACPGQRSAAARACTRFA